MQTVLKFVLISQTVFVFISTVSVTDAPAAKSSAEKPSETHWLRRLFGQLVRKSRVAPAPDDEGDDTKKETLQEAHSHNADELVEVVTVSAPSEEDKEDLEKTEENDSSSNSSESLQPPPVWFGRFMTIAVNHSSTDLRFKLEALFMFKSVISQQNPEFADYNEKDAHEFLIIFLDQLRSVSLLLQEEAAVMGRIYTCPVEDNFMFKMENSRTCKRCGARSTREEDFISLSLKLVYGSSVQEMLKDYLMETDVYFRCDCGANTSGQQYIFETLPRVLILHLKRFRVAQLVLTEKLYYPVKLFRELVVSSRQGDSWYSLMSVISYIGWRKEGHYISDGLHPDVELDDPGDRWLTYNDSEVIEIQGASVCQEREKIAYVLFYQRQM
ncbi:ubiquitin carboxyl-terminal hydrolase 37-like isoform X4 [Scomber scombrus]|uniref:Ubiquitin carboxyl-terminal hydrolase 37-like isoform X4 n=1 Tax=Scomber scombrus TaxID=13677 RepID=A0AAV1N9G0_SCOSC